MALDPSQRITLIKEISQRLSGEEWALIDLTLKQFSRPTTDVWSGERQDYVVAMIEEASDDGLVSMARHLGFELQASRPYEPPSFWEPGYFHLFLSHLSEHRCFAGDLQAGLMRFGIGSFVAHNDIEPTLEWQAEIEAALASCDALVALLHQGFHDSKWTDQEIGFAMGRGIPVFSVRLGEDPYGFIGRFQAFNGNGKNAETIASELFDVLSVHKQTARAVGSGIISRFESSESFADAKHYIQILEKLQVWETSFSQRLEAAVKRNGQIGNAWGVPSRVDTLVSSWAKTL